MATLNRSADARTHKAILAALDELGGKTVSEDSLIFDGERFVLPASMEGNMRAVIHFLEDWSNQQESTYSYDRTFAFRPWDGAAAFDRAMKRVFGTTGIGATTATMFGSNPPEFRTIPCGYGATMQVPWGAVAFSPLAATFYLGGTRDGMFNLTVEAPRKHRKRIEGFFSIVEDELRVRSIYKGAAITGAEMPEYLDLSAVNASQVVYSADTMTQLDANLWALLEHTDVMRGLGIPLKRAVLLEGPYGTGKTLAGALTAQRAVANGWTFVACRSGIDDLMDTLKTAQLYAPSVVWFEDIDVIGSNGSAAHISRLLDALDGIQAKGTEVIAGFTTNHADQLQKGLLRPGRIDTVVHIGELDAAGIRRLIEVTVPGDLLDRDVDWERVATVCAGYMPAYVREAAQRALRYSVVRNGGTPQSVATDDLIHAAQGLRAQHAIMDVAREGANGSTVDSTMRALVEEALQGSE